MVVPSASLLVGQLLEHQEISQLMRVMLPVMMQLQVWCVLLQEIAKVQPTAENSPCQRVGLRLVQGDKYSFCQELVIHPAQ